MADESTRTYRKRKRAKQEEETRRRITEAVVDLHRTVGPVNTRVTDVAERAGVSRMTVYSHFPTEADLIEACSTHWASQNPFPDAARWAAIEDPSTRLTTALEELYGWYADKADMMGNVLRDAPIVQPLGTIMDVRWEPWLDDVAHILADGWREEPGPPDDLVDAVRVAIDFGTWKLLSASGAEAAASLAARMVVGVAGNQEN